MIPMQKSQLILYLFLVALTLPLCSQQCKHPIFCNETILKAVADSNYFQNDSKQFVDLVLKVPISTALQVFSTSSISLFIKTCFNDPYTILETITLPDWKSSPQTFNTINDPKLKQLAQQINDIWKKLAYKVNLNYSSNGTCIDNCSSFLPELDGRTIIVPGGRFRESYYWDTYWIIKGLIASDMIETAEGLVENFFIVMGAYGYIPNGFRVYYLNRSQPPFLSLMVKEVASAYRIKGQTQKADDLQFRSFPLLIMQHDYWMSTHGKQYTLDTGRVITLNRYYADTVTGRPQSYKQDMQLVAKIEDEKQREYILRSLSTMAESGWDFSSRWLKDPNDLKSSVILEMIPSDLNMLMALFESYLSTLAGRYGRIDLLNKYQAIFKDRRQYFNEIYTGDRYPDKYPPNISLSNRLYPTDYFPYLMSPSQKANVTNIFTSLLNPNSSLIQTTQQWDAPNVWAPNNWILHEVLSTTQAFTIAEKWVWTVSCSMSKYGKCFEKYLNNKLGQSGDGGQYAKQDGFGWTNGLTLYYLITHGSSLKAPVSCQTADYLYE